MSAIFFAYTCLGIASQQMPKAHTSLGSESTLVLVAMDCLDNVPKCVSNKAVTPDVIGMFSCTICVQQVTFNI